MTPLERLARDLTKVAPKFVPLGWLKPAPYEPFEDAATFRGRMCSSAACRTVNLYRLGSDPSEPGDRCVKCGAPLEDFDPPL